MDTLRGPHDGPGGVRWERVEGDSVESPSWRRYGWSPEVATASLLEDIEPEVAIISLGNGNTHDHPTLKTLKRLAAAHVDRIFQTNWGTTKDGLLSNMTIPLEVRKRQVIAHSLIVLTTDCQS